MKRTLTTLLLALLMGNAFSSSPTGEPKELTKRIKKEIEYPKFAKDSKLEGLVMVHYIVESNGSIKVIRMNASHEVLADYVKERLENMYISDRGIEGEHFAKFNFKYVEI